MPMMGQCKPLREQTSRQLRCAASVLGAVAMLFISGAIFFLVQDRSWSFPVFACLVFAAFIFAPALPSLAELRRRRRLGQ
jgi:hypothetical protein